MGKPPEQLIGRPMAEAFEPEVFEKLAANDRRVMRGGVAVSFDETVPDARSTHRATSGRSSSRSATLAARWSASAASRST